MRKMACQAMYTWSLSGLVGVFLDLVIAYFLLCASAMAFMASKFLGFFGLCLPCPCNGLFGVTNPNSNLCLQGFLIDYPTEIVSNVQLSVKKKFPFNGFSSWERDKDGGEFNVDRIVEERRNGDVNGFVEMEGEEASCSSVTDGRKSRNFVRHREGLSGRNGNGVVREGRFDVKGKGVVNHRPRGWLRRRRKGGVDYGKVSSVSSCDPPFGDVHGGPYSACSSINNGGKEMVVESKMVDLDNGVDAHDSYYGQASRISGSGQRDRMILLDEFHEEDVKEKNLSSTEVVISKAPGEMASNAGDKHVIELLEQALREECAARTALYLELEEERNAAATAADEAMAMILRLQEEKASFEMEARQYQRIIEEKSAYDAEERNILKEILIRRETEKLFLEKEVEEYRQMINLVNKQLPDDGGDMVATDKQPLDSVLDPSEDPVLMLHQLSVAIDKKASIKDKSNDEDQKFQEKEIVSVGGNLHLPPQDGQRLETFPQSCESGSSQEHNFPEKTIPIIGEEHRRDGRIVDHGTMRNDIETQDRVESLIPNNDENQECHREDAFRELKDSCTMAFDKELQVDDVHVIVEGSSSGNKDKRSQSEQSLANDTSEGVSRTDLPPEAPDRQSLQVIRDCPSTSSLNAERDIQRSASDVPGRLPPIGPRNRSLVSDFRRNFMSPIEYERLKIDSEVDWLRQRLKIVQEGREKLNLSMENQEKEKLQLKLLEDISRHLQEIRQLTEPGKAIRQRSLPPPSTEVMSKKRRSHSVSAGLQKSS